jgi:hypothetical protein
VPPGANVMLTVIATSTTPITYQWFKNGAPIAGATSPTLNLLDVDHLDSAVYHVVLTDAVGTLASDPAAVAVLISPTIVVQPVGQTNVPGSTVTFSVQVTNTATLPVGYRWRRGGTSPFGTRLLYARTDFLTLTNIDTTMEANYSVVVTNIAANAGPSQSARLEVIAPMDMDSDGLPDAYETNNGLNPNNANDAHADSDLDGYTNTEEFIAGTDPQDSESYLRVEEIAALNGAVIRFRAVNSKTYSIQYRDGESEWVTLGGAPAIHPTSTDSRLVEVMDFTPPYGGIRIYRVVTPGQ